MWATSISRATHEDAIKILNIHREIYGDSIHVCITCPDSLRAAVNRLKVEYISRYGNNR